MEVLYHDVTNNEILGSFRYMFSAWIYFDVLVLVNTYPHSFVALARLNSYKYIKTISSVGKSTNFQTVL